MTKIIRPGTAIKALVGDRIRHVIVTGVTDQNNITVRVGSSDSANPTTVEADREPSTTTRGTLFTQQP